VKTGSLLKLQNRNLPPSPFVHLIIKKKKLTHFKIFNPILKLPTELRLKIWRSALPLFPRILEAKPHKPWSNTTERPRSPKWSITPTTTTPLLSISQEPRNELKKYYTTPFSPYNVFPAQGSPLDFRLVARGRPYVEPYPEINALSWILRIYATSGLGYTRFPKP
jgi:hypothetical protein